MSVCVGEILLGVTSCPGRDCSGWSTSYYIDLTKQKTNISLKIKFKPSEYVWVHPKWRRRRRVQTIYTLSGSVVQWFHATETGMKFTFAFVIDFFCFSCFCLQANFNDQIELLKNGRTLAGVPHLTIPGPPPYPGIPVLQSLVSSRTASTNWARDTMGCVEVCHCWSVQPFPVLPRCIFVYKRTLPGLIVW